MSVPTPLTSFLGGIGLTLPVHSLALLNGNVFGISGFVHRAVKGNREAIVATLGLIFGGLVVGAIEGDGPAYGSLSLPTLLISGFLVGLGTKMSNGCTSGHMLAGLSRFSKRSIAATATFFGTAVLTTRMLYPRTFSSVNKPNWNVNSTDTALLVAQIFPQLLHMVFSLIHAIRQASMIPTNPNTSSPSRPIARLAAFLSTTVEFALALRLSNMTDPKKVLAFLLLPFDSAFDPSLAFLALGAIPLGAVLYHFFRGPEKPALGGTWAIPRPSKVDAKLLIGSTFFGLGWGISGICPGPVLVNLGRALANGRGFSQWFIWLCAFIAGGLCAS
ncbi:hypothetical protein GYMLUDRAFT_172392 [Collybiopsis luxurians FD-317 M1]|uniref:Sulphur transport domain-containing protein n=1 Tax=Collybiopsis luxurians FD-317 M1 TaxID=944289 RepID=A0A0D0B369_9AGAR|nr:hypothetical protein GYMLUDRAFT_172392 [Collybiopsis luxurians FD-317 M1]